MNGLAERKPQPNQRIAQTHEQRIAYIFDICLKAEEGYIQDIKGWRKGKKLFGDLDFEELARGAGEVAEGVMAGPSLTAGEISAAIISAIHEKEFERLKGGSLISLATTNHILFQFYLIKSVFRQIAQSAK